MLPPLCHFWKVVYRGRGGTKAFGGGGDNKTRWSSGAAAGRVSKVVAWQQDAYQIGICDEAIVSHQSRARQGECLLRCAKHFEEEDWLGGTL